MLVFNSSKKPTIGIEIEMQILDPESLDLSPQSEKILNIARSYGDSRIMPEMHQSVIEINSEIGEGVKESFRFLKDRIARVTEMAESLGLYLSVMGTHPFQKWTDRRISQYSRYQNLLRRYQWLIRRMSVYGLHVHIGVQSGDKALKISKELAKYLPHLIALSGNSPFWQETETKMRSSRITIMESFPFSKPPIQCSSWKEFERYYNTLQHAGVIQSIKDLYWHIRPHPLYGTIEVRICDAMPTLSETIAVAALIQCLVVFIDEQLEANSYPCMSEEFSWLLPDNIWVAARDGLDGLILSNPYGKIEQISESILQLMETLRPIAKRLYCEEELLSLKELISKGSGADRQLAIYQETGSLKEVVSQMREEFYADLKEPLLMSIVGC